MKKGATSRDGFYSLFCGKHGTDHLIGDGGPGIIPHFGR